MARVLVVDDLPEDRLFVRTVLEYSGHSVVEASDGREGLDRARASKPDLVVTDLVMPGMDGFTFLMMLREKPGLGDVPVIVHSATYDEAECRTLVDSLGGISVLPKPAEPEALMAAVARLLGGVVPERPAPDVLLEREHTRLVHTKLFEKLEELEQANRRLQDMARRKDEFLALLAHELRNPLGPMRNALHALARAEDDPATRERLQEMMGRQLTHLEHLIHDILDMARLTRGRIQLRKQRLDLVRAVRDVAEDRRPTFESASLSLEVRTPDTPRWVRGDPTRLTQVVANLLDNALKFTPAGGQVTVEISDAADGRQAQIRVGDTGLGIEPDLLQRVFEPFAQGDRSLDRALGGLGLGLPMVRGLVELHGGQVRAESEGPGRGAHFLVSLPLLVDPPGQPTPPPEAADPQRSGLKILVVEDNRDAAESLRMVLELSDHRVDVAFTGSTGLDVARRELPDVMICDLGLPGMDGFSVARAVRSDPRLSETRMIAVTGYGSEEDRRRSREAGFDEHLTKPVDPLRLLQLLQAS